MSAFTIRPINTGYVTTVPKEYLYHHSVAKYLKNIPDEAYSRSGYMILRSARQCYGSGEIDCSSSVLRYKVPRNKVSLRNDKEIGFQCLCH